MTTMLATGPLTCAPSLHNAHTDRGDHVDWAVYDIYPRRQLTRARAQQRKEERLTAPTLWRRSQPRPETAALSRPTSSGSTEPTGSCRWPRVHTATNSPPAAASRPSSSPSELGVTDGLTSVYLDRPTVQGARGGGESETWLLYGGTANEARSISYGHAPPLPPPTRASADRSDTACFHFSVVF